MQPWYIKLAFQQTSQVARVGLTLKESLLFILFGLPSISVGTNPIKFADLAKGRTLFGSTMWFALLFKVYPLPLTKKILVGKAKRKPANLTHRPLPLQGYSIYSLRITL